MTKRTTLRIEFEITAEHYIFGAILDFVQSAREHLYKLEPMNGRCNIDVRRVEVIEDD